MRKREGAKFPFVWIENYKEWFLLGYTSDSNGELLKVSIYNDASTKKFSKKNNNNFQNTEMTKKKGHILDITFSELNDERDMSNLFTLHKNS